jgi:GMP synthase (glutamine-hydrolysing)
MQLHVFQHVPFEGPANIATWAADRGHDIDRTRLYAGETPPSVDAMDWLVVLGGPMGATDDEEYPWMAVEKERIRAAIDDELPVLGVCLGAQLIADVLGADVYPHDHSEIGWFPVQTTDQAGASPFTADLPAQFTAFHWHGDTFDLPDGATRLYETEACTNQAFVYDGHVLGLQFHLESTRESIDDLVAASDIDGGPYVQEGDRLRGDAEQLDSVRARLYTVLDAMAAEAEMAAK